MSTRNTLPLFPLPSSPPGLLVYEKFQTLVVVVVVVVVDDDDVIVVAAVVAVGYWVLVPSVMDDMYHMLASPDIYIYIYIALLFVYVRDTIGIILLLCIHT